MLLRNRSTAVTKPALVADHSSQPSPKSNQNYAKTTIPSLFGSQRLRDFTIKYFSGAEALRNPTSIFDTRALSPFGNPFSYENRTETIVSPRMHSEKRSLWKQTNSKGLALVGALKDEGGDESAGYGNVLFGTQHGVKIPTLSAADFGSKNKDSQNSFIHTKDSSPRAVIVTGAL